MHPNSTRFAITVALLAGVALGGALTAGLDVFADGDPSTDNVPRMIPYQGVLEFNGDPVNATDIPIHVSFDLYDGPEGPVVYTQQIPLTVYQGRFTTMIGPMDDNGTSIAEVVAAADDLHLGMTLLNEPNNPDDDVPMSNRQRILSTPYAMWSTTATDFAVDRDLTVSGTTRLGAGRPPSNTAQLILAPNVAEDGVPDNFNDYQLIFHQGGSPATTYGVGIQNNTMFFNTNSDFKFYDGGELRLHLDNANVRATGNLTVDGEIRGDFQMTIGGEVRRERNNSGGTSSTNLGASNGRRFCFLTYSGAEDIDSQGEWARCRVIAENGQWKIQAQLGGTSDADAYCGARCISW